MSDVLPSMDKECFFIAPIGKDGSPERNRSDGVLEFIVGRAAEELGLTAVRADQIAEPGQITLQVIDHILGAKAAVADLTGQNANVFYELAVRHTARLPVALIAEKGCTLPFDIAQMRTIFFEYTDLRSADQCRRDVVAHLRQGLESGAVDSPIATTIDVKAMANGSIVERNIAEMVTTLEEMARSQKFVEERVDRLRWDLRRTAALSPKAYDAFELSLDRLVALERRISELDDMEMHKLITQLGHPMRFLAEELMARKNRRTTAFLSATERERARRLLDEEALGAQAGEE